MFTLYTSIHKDPFILRKYQRKIHTKIDSLKPAVFTTYLPPFFLCKIGRGNKNICAAASILMKGSQGG